MTEPSGVTARSTFAASVHELLRYWSRRRRSRHPQLQALSAQLVRRTADGPISWPRQTLHSAVEELHRFIGLAISFSTAAMVARCPALLASEPGRSCCIAAIRATRCLFVHPTDQQSDGEEEGTAAAETAGQPRWHRRSRGSSGSRSARKAGCDSLRLHWEREPDRRNRRSRRRFSHGQIHIGTEPMWKMVSTRIAR